MTWFVREVWQADGDSDWAQHLEAELDDLEERGHELVAVTSHLQKSGKPSKAGIRYVLFCKVGG
jgi:hypothetical protein